LEYFNQAKELRMEC